MDGRGGRLSRLGTRRRRGAALFLSGELGCRHGDERATRDLGTVMAVGVEIGKARGRRRQPQASTTETFSCASMWRRIRSEEHTSELQSLMRISYAVFCLKKKKTEK